MMKKIFLLLLAALIYIPAGGTWYLWGDNRILDANKLWSTYFGGTGSDEITSMSVSGNFIYLTGTTTSKGSSSLAGPGAYQGNNKGGKDAFVAKFDRNGNRIWSTYYGGSGNDEAFAVIHDGSNGLTVIAGQTSSEDLPVPGEHNRMNYSGGGTDAFIAVFDDYGSLQWASYYGGTGLDAIKGLYIKGNNLYTVGKTNSNDIPLEEPLEENDGGGYDGFIARFDSRNGVMEWSTYFGGNGDDEINGITMSNDIIYIAGTTSSTEGIAKGESFSEKYGGGASDAFIAKINERDEVLWASYLGGTGEDAALKIAGYSTSLFIAGYTNSPTGIAFGNAMQKNPAGMKDGLLAVFNSEGNLTYSTYAGGAGDDIIRDIDISGDDIALTGTTTSQNLATNNAFYSELKGGSDAFCMLVTKSGKMNLAGYFGGEQGENGYGIFDTQDHTLLIAGSTYSSTGISTPDAFQKENAGSTDGFLSRIDPRKKEYEIDVSVDKQEYCAGDAILIKIGVNSPFPGGNTYKVELSDENGSFSNPVLLGSFNATADYDTQAVLPTNIISGKGYKIRVTALPLGVVGIGPGEGFTVYNLGQPFISGEKTACLDEQYVEYKIEPQDFAAYQWTVDGGNISNGQGTSSIKVNWNEAGNGLVKVLVTAGACMEDGRVEVAVEPAPVVTLAELPDLCLDGDVYNLSGGKPAGGKYYIDGEESEVFNPQDRGIGSHEIKYVYTSPGGCSGEAARILTVRENPPKPTITFNNSRLVSSSQNGNQWYYEGTLIDGAEGREIIPKKTGNYYVVVTNEFGCRSVASDNYYYKSSNGPHLSGVTKIDFGELICNEDAMREFVISNTGEDLLAISSINLAGPDKDDFTINDDNFKKEILPGQSSTLKVIFFPKSTGVKMAQLVILSNDPENGETAVKLLGTKQKAAFHFSQELAEFKDIKENATAEKSITVTNDGTVPLEWKYTADYPEFAITGFTPEITPPGGSSEIKILFKGGIKDQIYTQDINFLETTCDNNFILKLKANVIDDSAGIEKDTFLIDAGKTAGNTGDSVVIPIYIHDADKIIALGKSTLTTEIKLNSTLLDPIGETPEGKLDGNTRTIKLDIPLQNIPLQEILLQFRANLGDDSTTAIAIQNTSVPGLEAEFREISGTFTLLNICRQGGPRLITFIKNTNLSITPNPANNTLKLDYDLVETGKTTLSIYDYSGRMVKMILDDEMQKGSYEQVVNINELGQGSYYIILSTPTIRKTYTLNIIR